MPTPSQEHRSLALATPLGKDVLAIERISGNESLSAPFEYRVTAVATKDGFAFDDIIGQRVTVTLETEEAANRYFNGHVSQIVHTGYALSGLSRYELTVVPWIWFLSKTADCRIFQDKSVPEIVKEVFSDLGFNDHEFRLTGSYKPRVYCVQYRETDLNFVQRLLEHEGIYYFAEHSSSGHKLVFCDAMSAHKPVPGFESLLYRAHDSGIRDHSRIHSWHIRHRVTPGAFAVNSFNFETPVPSPSTKLLGLSMQPHTHRLGDYEVYDNPGDFIERSEGERYAKIRREEAQVSTKTITATTDARGLFVGCIFGVKENPRKDQNGQFLITSASFQAQCGNYSSGSGTGEDTYECSFSGIPKAATFRPARTAYIPVVQGPQTAMVVGPSGEEIHTDKYGRVKVQFFWDRYGKFDAGSSCWVRVAQIWAGKGWGGITIPRIGQEVIVEFLEGNPDRPIITGRVYNADAMPPYELPGNATRSTIKTNSSKGGGGFNEIRIEDKKGSEQIFIHAEKNRDLRVKKDNHEFIGENEHIIVKKDRFEEVEGDVHLKVGGERNEEASESASLKAGQNILQKAGMRLAQEAGTEMHLKAGMNLIIEAGASITLKAGGGFITVGPTGVAISGTPVLINSGGAAGSGAGCSPSAPQKPKEADKANPGKSDKAASGGSNKKKRTPGTPSPTAVVLKQAAQSGTPFCEICEKGNRR